MSSCATPQSSFTASNHNRRGQRVRRRINGKRCDNVRTRPAQNRSTLNLRDYNPAIHRAANNFCSLSLANFAFVATANRQPKLTVATEANAIR